MVLYVDQAGGIQLIDRDEKNQSTGIDPTSGPIKTLLPPSLMEKVDLIDSIDFGGDAGCLLLLGTGDDLFNLWLNGPEGVPIHMIEGNEMERLFHFQLDLFRRMRPLDTREGRRVRYQTFTERDTEGIAQVNGAFDLLRENENHVIRKVSGERTYQMEFLRSTRKQPMGSYMLSRLSTQGSQNVPNMIGMSYWDMEDGNAPWMRLTEHPTGAVPSFRSFLSVLKDIGDEFVQLSGTRSKRYLLELSRADHPSFAEARRIGEALGSIHGTLLMEGPAVPSDRGSERQISDLFRPSSFNMIDVGTTIGTGSFYLTRMKRDFVRLLGDRPGIDPVTGRRMKTLKKHPDKLRLEGVDWSAMDIFRTHFRKVETRMRRTLGLIRTFRSSPTLPSGMDCRLERIQLGPEKNYIFNGFDFEFFGVEEGKLDRFLPLKDLAMVLNSFTKARYLTARRTFRSMEPKVDPKPLTYLFLDYNLSKGTYGEMMKDYNVLRVFEGKEMPFSFVHKISLVGALWFERARNFLVEGYVNSLTDMGHDELLSYPKGADTIKGIRLIRSLLGLSGTLRSLDQGGVSSSAGLESDLLCALSI
ncbi:MAG: hypothetical protein R6V01_07840 [Thermoplasmatota archaeon]